MAKLFFITVIVCLFSVAECEHISELHLNTHFQNVKADLRNIPNITQKLSETYLAVNNQSGTWDLNLRNAFCTYLFITNISVMCRRQMNILCNNEQAFVTMLDAWSKIPYTGMQVRSRFDLGTFDQCMSIDLKENDVRVVGKHCVGGLILPLTLNITEENIMSSVVALSYCIPSQCSGTDLYNMIGILPVRELINDQMCTAKLDNSVYDGNAIPILFIFLMFVVVATMSTIFDISIHLNNKKIRFPLLIAFSFYSNGKKLFQTSPLSSANKEQILCFHGLKVISMLWITAGHYAVSWESLPLVNDVTVKTWLNQRYSQYIATAHLAVDTFFFISGFLLAYQYFKKQASKSIITQVKSLPMLIFQRYLRLTPSLLMYYLFVIGLARYFLNGPLQSLEADVRRTCEERWWSILLYIENYYDWRNPCLITLWYLSADMQLFLVAPFIMIPVAWQLQRSFKAALFELIFFCVIFTGLPLFTKLWFPEYDPEYGEYDSHSRLVDYFIGFTFGFIIRQKRNKPFIFSDFMNMVLWFLSLGAMLATVLVLHEINMHYGYTAKACMYTFMRPVWCLSLCWIVYSCINEKGGGINWILSNGLMQCGGRLTYAMYLLHVIVILQWALSIRTTRYFSDLEMFYINTGIFVLTWFICIFWTLMFESPIIIIMKVLLEGGSGRKRLENNNTDKLDIVQSNANNIDRAVMENNIGKNDLKNLFVDKSETNI